MLKNRLIICISIIAISCTSSNKNSEVQLISINQQSSNYQIIFMSDVDFSTRTSSRDTGSYIFCLPNKEIYKPEYTPNFSDKNYVHEVIIKDSKPLIDKKSGRYIYHIDLDYPIESLQDKPLYCRIFTGKYFGKLKKSKVFIVQQ